MIAETGWKWALAIVTNHCIFMTISIIFFGFRYRTFWTLSITSLLKSTIQFIWTNCTWTEEGASFTSTTRALWWRTFVFYVCSGIIFTFTSFRLLLMISGITTFVTESVTIFFESTVTFLFTTIDYLIATNGSIWWDKTFSFSLKNLCNIPDWTRRELIIIKTITSSGTTLQSFKQIAAIRVVRDADRNTSEINFRV